MPPFYIPSVDISPYLEDPTSPEAQTVIDNVRTACISTGFFQLLGHGISPDLQKAALKAAERFFELPMERKMALKAGPMTGFKGYEVLLGQSYQTDVLPDLKEGFTCSLDLPEGDERRTQKRFLTAPNVWPEELAPGEFREPVEAYQDAMLKLCNVVLNLLAATLPFSPHVFDDFKTDPACPLRLLHYPPMVADTSKQQGASAHTDFGAVTLLLQDEHEGLEVLDYETGEWRLVPPNKDAYVVNLGDMMTKLLGGRYKSSMHRVINRAPTDRYSIVYFFDGCRNFELRPLGEGAVDGNGEPYMTAEEYMFDRMKFSFQRVQVKTVA
jgi:isopenicillin N synthase-like dioxygenase